MTGLADRLVDRGLARREEDDSDRRVVRLAPTSAGRLLIEELVAQRREQLLRLFARLGPEEQAELGRALGALLCAAGEQE